MNSLQVSESFIAVDTPDVSFLIPLVERGLLHIQHGRFTEGAAFLALVREQLPVDQVSLATVLDTFLQQYASYQLAEDELQTVVKRFATAQLILQECAATFGATVLPLIHNSHIPLPSFHTYSTPLQKQSSPVQQRLSLLSSSAKDGALPELSITCFGRFEVRRLGEPVALCASRSGQSIFRYLAANEGHSATSDLLQDMLWPEDEPEVAKRKLHIAASALRRSLDQTFPYSPAHSYIICKQQMYSLTTEACIRTDVEEFLRYYQEGKQAREHSATVALYEQSCRLYTGPFLAEEMYMNWTFLQREQLNHIYLTMCRTLTDQYLKGKDYEDAAKWANRMLKEDQCDEAAHVQLMHIYIAQGRRSEALQQYHRCKQMLCQELGVQPLPETNLIFHNILSNPAFMQEMLE